VGLVPTAVGVGVGLGELLAPEPLEQAATSTVRRAFAAKVAARELNITSAG